MFTSIALNLASVLNKDKVKIIKSYPSTRRPLDVDNEYFTASKNLVMAKINSVI